MHVESGLAPFHSCMTQPVRSISSCIKLETHPHFFSQLWYTSTPRYDAFYGQGTGPLLLDDLVCRNTEERLIDCQSGGQELE